LASSPLHQPTTTTTHALAASSHPRADSTPALQPAAHSKLPIPHSNQVEPLAHTDVFEPVKFKHTKYRLILEFDQEELKLSNLNQIYPLIMNNVQAFLALECKRPVKRADEHWTIRQMPPNTPNKSERWIFECKSDQTQAEVEHNTLGWLRDNIVPSVLSVLQIRFSSSGSAYSFSSNATFEQQQEVIHR
jgi:hypothetical protein